MTISSRKSGSSSHSGRSQTASWTTDVRTCRVINIVISGRLEARLFGARIAVSFAMRSSLEIDRLDDAFGAEAFPETVCAWSALPRACRARRQRSHARRIRAADCVADSARARNRRSGAAIWRACSSSKIALLFGKYWYSEAMFTPGALCDSIGRKALDPLLGQNVSRGFEDEIDGLTAHASDAAFFAAFRALD